MTAGAAPALHPRVGRAGGRGHRRPAPLGRALLVGIAGLVLTAYGFGVHLAHAVIDGPSPFDWLGIAIGLVGLALVVQAYRLGFGGRRWRAKLVAIPVTLVLLQWFLLPLVTGALVSNAPRGTVAPAASLGLTGARDVRLDAADGIRLAGWYVPGRNGAGVVVMHGSHGDRASTDGHVRLLAGMGFAVLAIDARGHGESAGSTNAAGWTAADDVAGAVEFMRRQPGVAADRVAALGLSMGGEAMLRAAGEGVPLRAVVAEGAGASTLGDQRLVSPGAIPSSVSWVSMRAAELFTGDAEPPPLHREVRRIAAPVLLIASNATDELALDRTFQRRIGANARVWSVPDAGHTDALDTHPGTYAARVAAFLEASMGDRDDR